MQNNALNFNLSSEEVILNKIPVANLEIPQGADDIARMLDIDPQKFVMDYNVVCEADSSFSFPDQTLGAIHQGIVSLLKGDATGLTLSLYNGFLEYLSENIGVNPNNVIQIQKQKPKKNYFHPEHSVHACLQKIVDEADPEGLKKLIKLQGKTYYPVFTTEDTHKAAESLGMNLLSSKEKTLQFNSKVGLYEKSKEYNYNVPPFIIAENLEAIEPSVSELLDQAARDNLFLENAEPRLWVKFDHQVGGLGVKKFRPGQENISDVLDWAHHVMAESAKSTSGTDQDNIQKPSFIIDLDVKSLRSTKDLVADANTQAIIGKKGIYFTGVALQETSKEGKYIGGVLPRNNTERRYAEMAKKFALPVFQALHRQGYVGYVGIDTLICKTQDDKFIGYNLDLNARLNSSTSLLSIAHWVERESGHQIYAKNLTRSFERTFENFDAFEKAFEDLMFYRQKGTWEGVIPIILKSSEDGEIAGAKTVIVARSNESLNRLCQAFQGRF